MEQDYEILHQAVQDILSSDIKENNQENQEETIHNLIITKDTAKQYNETSRTLTTIYARTAQRAALRVQEQKRECHRDIAEAIDALNARLKSLGLEEQSRLELSTIEDVSVTARIWHPPRVDEKSE